MYYEFPKDCKGCKYEEVCQSYPLGFTCIEIATFARIEAEEKAKNNKEEEK